MGQANLCTTCRVLFSTKFKGWGKMIACHSSYSGLMESVHNGCVLCRWLSLQIPSPDDVLTAGVQENVSGHGSFQVFCHFYVVINATTCYRARFEGTCSWAPPFHLEVSIYPQETVSFNRNDTPGPSNRSCLPLLQASRLADIGLDGSFEKINAWLANCGNDHKYCTTNINAPIFPTRVIDVGNFKNGTVVLRDQEEVLGSSLDGDCPKKTYPEYWTLSHRWGDPKKILQLLNGNPDKGTISNERHFRDGITLKELSPTFRDAMEVVNRLGYRYIWIDSLCIFQDSHADWEQESRTMKDVYGNSFCNISAIRSSHDVALGLFGPRVLEPGLLFPFSVDRDSIVCFCDDNDDDKPTKWSLWHNSLWVDEIDKAPLSSRGWIVQERFLARRTIYFTRNQIFWECLEYSRCEADPEGQLGLLDPDSQAELAEKIRVHKFALKTIIKHLHDEPDLSWLKDHGSHSWSILQDCWGAIVTAYSSCDLTQETDRLVAISGLAKKLREVEDVRYLAGLWERQLDIELMWNSPASQGAAVRRSEASVPSWSWASIRGPIIPMDRSTLRDFGPPFPLIELVDVRIEPQSHNGDSMGLLKTAELDIECYLYHFKTIGKSKYFQIHLEETMSANATQIDEALEQSLDTEELVRKFEQDEDIEGACIPVHCGRLTYGISMSVGHLLLEKVSGSTFRRLGTIRTSSYIRWENEAVRTRITLI